MSNYNSPTGKFAKVSLDQKEADILRSNPNDTLAIPTDADAVYFGKRKVACVTAPATRPAMKLRYVETVKDLPRCAHQMPGDDSRGALRLLCGKKKDAEHDLETTGWVCLADKHIYMWAHGEGDTLDGLYKDLGSFGGEGTGEPPHYIKEAEVDGANAERLILTEKNGNTIAFEPFSNFNKTALEKARKVAKGTVLANQIDDLHQIGDNGVYMVEAYRGTTLEVGLLVVVEDMRSLVHQYYFGAMNPADWRPLTTDDQEGIYTRRYENGSWSEWKKYGGGSDVVDLGEFERSKGGEDLAATVEYAGNADILMMSYTIAGAGKAIIHQTVNESRSTQFLVLGGFWFTRYITFTDDSRTAISQVTAWWRTMPTNVEYNAGTRRVRLVDYNCQHSLPLNSANDGFELPLADGATDGLMSKEDKSKLDGITGGGSLVLVELPMVVAGSVQQVGITKSEVEAQGLSYEFVMLRTDSNRKVVLRTFSAALPESQRAYTYYQAYSGFEHTPEEWYNYLIKSGGDIWRYGGGSSGFDLLIEQNTTGVIHFAGTTTGNPDMMGGVAPSGSSVYYNTTHNTFVAQKGSVMVALCDDMYSYGKARSQRGTTQFYTGKLYIDADNNLWHSVDGTSLVKVTT